VSLRAAPVRVEGVSKRFSYRPYARGSLTLKSALLDAILLRPRPSRITVEALRDVSLTVAPGEAVGLIGGNGAGKTTLLRLLAGVYRPDRGSVHVAERRGILLELGGGFHPDLTGWENAEIAALIAGTPRSELKARLPEIVAFAELEDAMDAPLRTYSAGMGIRLGFAVASCLTPDLLVIDEALAVGDAHFQRKCRARIDELRARGAALVLASHDLEVVEAICDRALWLDRGLVVEQGRPSEVCARYRARHVPGPDAPS
jgi:ABC-type polysaccharide/polyol phosphate transport system ATPase subunit